ncbi:MAG: hypothetical protein GXY09_08505 [Bacteroidales bacterium]|nr:hypothetical protein [Bacteroidales bacterium]
MKKALGFLLLAGLLSVTDANAQIEKEIINYVDTTEQLVKNGKRLLVDRLLANDYEKANEVVHYLQDLKETKNYPAFNYKEDLFLSLLLHDWLYFDELAKNIKLIFKNTVFEDPYDIADILRKEVEFQASALDSTANNASLDPSLKSLIHVFCYLLSAEKIDEQWNKELNAHAKIDPNKTYQDFIDLFLPDRYARMSTSYTFGANYVYPTSTLNDYFKPAVGFNMSWDFAINRIYTSLNLDVSTFRARHPFVASTTNGPAVFLENDPFNNLNYALQAGYLLVRSKRFHVAPFVSLGGSNLVSNIYQDTEDDDKEMTVYNSFAPGLGLHTECLLFKYNSAQSYNGEMSGYISLRFDAGTNFTINDPSGMEGDNMYARLSCAFGFGDF